MRLSYKSRYQIYGWGFSFPVLIQSHYVGQTNVSLLLLMMTLWLLNNHIVFESFLFTHTYSSACTQKCMHTHIFGPSQQQIGRLPHSRTTLFNVKSFPNQMTFACSAGVLVEYSSKSICFITKRTSSDV